MLIKEFVAALAGLTYHGKTKEKKIALTFDDGPNEAYTERILNILEREGIKAVFFVNGEPAEKHPELIRLIHEKGHSVGNHSYRHAKDADTRHGIEKTGEILKNILGIAPAFFRPPWGKVTFKSINYCRANKIRIILWSLDSEDYKINDARELVSSMAKRGISSGDIVLFHDDYAHTAEALPEIIADIRSRGFSFASLEELLN